MTGILKTKPLTQLLSQSISPNVSWALLLTHSGALLATGTPANPADAKKARTHAALAASIWCAYDRIAAQGSIEQCLPDSSARQLASSSAPESTTAPPAENAAPGLRSLTLELSDYNLHIQVVAPGVLLCLIGPKYPASNTSSNSSLHSADAVHATGGSPPGSVPKSSGSAGSATHTGGTRTPAGESMKGTSSPGAMGVGGSLGILKTQAQGLVNYLEKELQGFELREGL